MVKKPFLKLILIILVSAVTGLYIGFNSGLTYPIFNLDIRVQPDFDLRNISQIELLNKTSPGNWIQVSKSISVYSAFWIKSANKQGKVVIIGMVDKSVYTNKDLKCFLKYNENQSNASVSATIEKIPENHGSDDCATFFYCPARRSPPIEVSLFLSAANEYHIWIPVEAPPRDVKKSGKFSVCVRPFFDNYNKVLQIAEFVAFYTQLGVNHFTFYNYEASSNIVDLIQNLSQAEYSIDLLSWDLLDVGKHSWQYGQLASINDCIFRSLGKFQYVIIIDVDEFIMPQKDMNLIDVIKRINAPSNTGSFNIRNSFFCLDYPKDKFANTTPPLLTQTKLHRQNKIWPYNQRSKYIVKPEALGVAGIHTLSTYRSPFKQYNVPTEIVLLNHYRDCGCKNCTPELKDNRSLRFKDYLLNSKAIRIYCNTTRNC